MTLPEYPSILIPREAVEEAGRQTRAGEKLLALNSSD